jgi:hypothetical protein
MLKHAVRPMFTCAFVIAAACGGDTEADDTDTNDLEPDAAPGVDAGACEPATVLPTQWRAIAEVSSGEVAADVGKDFVITADIDASAGGLAGAADSPYTYVNLMTGARVDIDDVEALDNPDWHIAFKRASIRLNGGDSGTGDVTAGMVDAAFEDVDAAPADFVADDWASDACEFLATPGGEPATAIGDWYDYDPETHVVTPWPRTWVISVGGYHLKLVIDTYYGNEASPMSGGFFRVRWTPLS